ncbi:glucosamine-6-phosphate deaminase [Pengzhenrongella sp.]|jgi:glucosamine-6-phosphate deaminase|uniref:glucosamine-6-phosphate deaminase n=1 Tax=Pengzhenrongella sp. TaxID=2888820 RepID=UPI002F94828B
MKVIIRKDSATSARAAAAQISTSFHSEPHGVLGIATGSSPQPLYEALTTLVADGLDLGGITAFALDEYVGLDPSDPQSYRSIIDRDVTVPLRLDRSRVFVPEGGTAAVTRTAAAYDSAIREAGGIRLQILGIGTNGHIGFNEPGSPRDSRTRVVGLTESTRADNSRFFTTPSDVPSAAVSQGIGTICEALAIIVMANGSHKAEAVRDAIEGPVTEESPASILQLHPDVTFYLDEDAASLLRENDRADDRHDAAAVLVSRAPIGAVQAAADTPV